MRVGICVILIVFSIDQLPKFYVPRVFENYVADTEIDGNQVEWQQDKKTIIDLSLFYTYTLIYLFFFNW